MYSRVPVGLDYSFVVSLFPFLIFSFLFPNLSFPYFVFDSYYYVFPPFLMRCRSPVHQRRRLLKFNWRTEFFFLLPLHDNVLIYSQHAPWACRSPRINPPPAAAATVWPFYSNFDWLEGLASWQATNLLLYLQPSCRYEGLPACPSCFPATHVSYFIGGGMLCPSGATLWLLSYLSNNLT
jgi:hypothetical protein